MGVPIVEILKIHPMEIKDLSNKEIAVDAPNHLYQFLTTIRSPDGSHFTDSKGNITSHLIGLFSRTTNLMQKKIRLAYVFDGTPPKLKHKELQQRLEIKKEAEMHYQKALEAQDIEGMKKYSSRTSRLTKEMINEAKTLLSVMGIPCIDAPSEAGAQAAFIAKNNDAYAVSSQDADSLLFGAPRVIRNMSITGKRKKAGKHTYKEISPELIELGENLNILGIGIEQLIALSMLVGTDYNPGGIKGIGPKKGLIMVKKHGQNFNALFEEAEWSRHFEESWEQVYDTFKTMPVTKNYTLEWKNPEKEKIMRFLCDEHDFSPERVEKTIDAITTSQRGLKDFL